MMGVRTFRALLGLMRCLKCTTMVMIAGAPCVGPSPRVELRRHPLDLADKAHVDEEGSHDAAEGHVEHREGDREREASVGEEPLVVEDDSSAEEDPLEHIPAAAREGDDQGQAGQFRYCPDPLCGGRREGKGGEHRQRSIGCVSVVSIPVCHESGHEKALSARI